MKHCCQHQYSKEMQKIDKEDKNESRIDPTDSSDRDKEGNTMMTAMGGSRISEDQINWNICEIARSAYRLIDVYFTEFGLAWYKITQSFDILQLLVIEISAFDFDVYHEILIVTSDLNFFGSCTLSCWRYGWKVFFTLSKHLCDTLSCWRYGWKVFLTLS